MRKEESVKVRKKDLKTLARKPSLSLKGFSKFTMTQSKLTTWLQSGFVACFGMAISQRPNLNPIGRTEMACANKVAYKFGLVAPVSPVLGEWAQIPANHWGQVDEAHPKYVTEVKFKGATIIRNTAEMCSNF